MTEQLIHQTFSNDTDIADALRGARFDDALQVTIDTGELTSCLNALHADGTLSRPMRVESGDGGCYVALEIMGAPSDVVIDNVPCHAAAAAIHEIGSATGRSPSGYGLSMRGALVVTAQRNPAAGGYLFFNRAS
jgi:hypothetical protein